MIARKLKICIDCQSPQYLFSHGRCKHCDTLSKLAEKKPKVGEVYQEKQAQWHDGEFYKAKYRVVSVESSAKYQTTSIKRKPLKQKDEYKGFFESLTIPERCEECNQVLLAFNNFGRRCVSAHILPKSTFKSVAKHPDNILFLGSGILGGCRCHDTYDSCIENRKSMRVYETALSRLEGFKHLLTDKEIVMAEKYLGL